MSRKSGHRFSDKDMRKIKESHFMDKPQIAVIGAGLMGQGIAYLFAAGGYCVRVQDPVREALDKLPQRIGDICDLIGTDRAAVERVSAGPSIEWVVSGAGIVIEAAPEKLALKQTIFADLERFAAKEAILASNTSALPITHIAAGLENKDRMLGAHFWNPPHLVPLVEIVLMSEANRPAADRLAVISRAVGRHPVFVHRDIPASSATACSMRSSAKRLRSSLPVCATPKRSTTWSSTVSARGLVCSARWSSPIWSGSISPRIFTTR
jgi:3-hydroxyacyl-CoA dehydrogenase